MTTVDEAVSVLNEIHAADPTVLPALIACRVPCNDIVADHPTVQVGPSREDPDGPNLVGLLGVLNGVFGIMPNSGSGYIAAYYDDDGTLTHFGNLDAGRD